ncbi:hypothetical protein HDU84_000052 [Entophlyctis sp. JEL0112]|nr:hypothetical protein HDU84_000052 [Entophlyctis sp. JEL0112]
MRARASSAFKDNDIDGHSLLALDIFTLKSELELSSFGLRIKLISAIDALRSLTKDQPTSTPVSQQPAQGSSPHRNLSKASGKDPFITFGSNKPLVRFSKYFMCRNFDWSDSNCESNRLAADSRVFNLLPRARQISEVEVSDFSIKLRLERPQAFRATTVSIQKKLKRFLSGSNLTVFDADFIAAEDMIDENAFYSKLKQVGVLAIWSPRSRNSNSPLTSVRVFKRSVDGVIFDFLDNSGSYVFNTCRRSSHLNRQSYISDNDEVFPLYGESDHELYTSDSEWETEAANLIPVEPDIPTDVEADMQTARAENNLTVSVEREQTGAVHHWITTEIAKRVDAYRNQWRQEIFPNIQFKARSVYDTRLQCLQGYRKRLIDITGRLLPKITEAIVEVCLVDCRGLASEESITNSVDRVCQNLQMCVYEQMELEWRCQICKSSKPPASVAAFEKIKGKRKANRITTGSESETWSDFLGSSEDASDLEIQVSEETEDEEDKGPSDQKEDGDVASDCIQDHLQDDGSGEDHRTTCPLPSAINSESAGALAAILATYDYPDSPSPALPENFYFSVPEVAKLSTYQPFVVFSLSHILRSRLDDEFDFKTDAQLLSQDLHAEFNEWYRFNEIALKTEENTIISPNSEQMQGSDEEESFKPPPKKGRRNLRPIGKESASARKIRELNKSIQAEISERAQRQTSILPKNMEKVLINLGHSEFEAPIYIDDFLALKLKPHQIKGVQFLWRSTIMVKNEDDEKNPVHQGCVLAHAMGLGKTLQVITFLHTLQREVKLNNPCLPEHLRTGGILIVCPSVVVDNWVNEILKWIPAKERDDVMGDTENIDQVESWNDRRGLFILSYNRLRYILAEEHGRIQASADATTASDSVKAKKFWSYFISPGPKLVICDEGHMTAMAKKENELTAGLAALQEYFKTTDHVDWDDVSLSQKMVFINYAVAKCSEIGDKVLIFSRSIPTAHFLLSMLKKQHKVQILTGSTPASVRQKLIDDFNNQALGFQVFVISTVAGGVGINITSANRVIIVDQGWNPRLESAPFGVYLRINENLLIRPNSGEEQAIARSYRFGQQKKVFVYRLVLCGGLDEKLLMNSIHKIALASQVVDQKNMEKTSYKNIMKQYFTQPPENPQSEVLLNVDYGDAVLMGFLKIYAAGVVKVELHAEFIREVESDWSEQQFEDAKEALTMEVHRRKNKLPFTEISPRENISVRAIPIESLLDFEFPDEKRDDEDVIDVDAWDSAGLLDVPSSDVMQRSELGSMAAILHRVGEMTGSGLQ